MHERMRQALSTTIAMTLAVALGGTALAQSVGTWKLNPAKSTYAQGQGLKSATIVYEAAGAGIKVTVDQVPATGPAVHFTYTANYDGKDVPLVGSPFGDTAARTRVNPTTTKTVNKKDGQILSTLTIVTSADGKTLTVTAAGKNVAGQNIDSVSVYEKQ